MTNRHLAYALISAFWLTLFFATINLADLSHWAIAHKSALVWTTIAATWLASAIEFAGLIRLDRANQLTTNDLISAAAKAVAAVALIATVLASAQDLAG